MASLQNEQSATATPTIQQPSFNSTSQQQSVLLKENFQFYQTWSPNSLEEIDYEYGNVDDTIITGSYPIVVAPPNYGPLQQQPPPLTSWQERYTNNQNPEKAIKNNVDVADAATATTNFLAALDINNNQGDGMTVSAPPVLNTPQRLKKSLNSLLTTPTLDPLFDDYDEGPGTIY